MNTTATNRRNEIRLIMDLLDITPHDTDFYDALSDRYFELRAVEQEEYRNENIGKLKEYWEKHIAGKTFAEVDDDAWEWYSDFHKDVFGYRPRSLEWHDTVEGGL